MKELSRRSLFGALVGAGASTAATAATALVEIKPESEYREYITVKGIEYYLRWTGWKESAERDTPVAQFIAIPTDYKSMLASSSFPGAVCCIYERKRRLVNDDFLQRKPEALEAAKKDCYYRLIKFLHTL